MSHISHVAAAGPARAETVFESRFHELVGDLRLDPAPEVSWTDAANPSLTINGNAMRLPRRLARLPREEPAEEIGERIATALFRTRWSLLAPALQSREPQPDSSLVALAELAELGLDLDDLTAVARAAASGGPASYAWMAAERRPAQIELLLPPSSAWPAPDTLRTATDFAREISGLPLPEPELARDYGLTRGRARLRVRAVRTPVIGEVANGETATELDPLDLAGLIGRYAAMLVDPEMITRVLLCADPGTVALLPEMLRKADAPRLATAVRPLLEGGFGLPDAPALIQAVLAASRVAEADGRRLALSGTVVVGGVDLARDALAARLRASIVPGALLRRAGGLGRVLSCWYLSREQADRLPLDDAPESACDVLAPLALPAARAEAVLLVPDGLGTRIWHVLRDELPSISVVEVAEWPAGLEQRPRGAIIIH
jgi:hypothetical protein